MKQKILTTAVLLFFLVSLFAQDGWELVKDKDGIKVYTRKAENIDFKEFKGTVTIDQSVSSFLAVISDVENLTEWVYSIVKAKKLRQTGDTLLIYYAESKVPWPFDNRDAVYEEKVSWDNTNRILMVNINCLPEYTKPKDGIVRIPFAKGFWRVEELENHHIKVTFRMLVDPGGTIPAWLANAFVVDSPFETLKGLTEVIGKSSYQNKAYGFIK
jgi:hypothetical protein